MSEARKCHLCGGGIRVPERFNAMLFCPVRNLRAVVNVHNAPKYTTRNGHILVQVAKGAAPPKLGILARAAAAARSAIAVLRAKP